MRKYVCSAHDFWLVLTWLLSIVLCQRNIAEEVKLWILVFEYELTSSWLDYILDLISFTCRTPQCITAAGDDDGFRNKKGRASDLEQELYVCLETFLLSYLFFFS